MFPDYPQCYVAFSILKKNPCIFLTASVCPPCCKNNKFCSGEILGPYMTWFSLKIRKHYSVLGRTVILISKIPLNQIDNCNLKFWWARSLPWAWRGQMFRTALLSGSLSCTFLRVNWRHPSPQPFILQCKQKLRRWDTLSWDTAV